MGGTPITVDPKDLSIASGRDVCDLPDKLVYLTVVGFRVSREYGLIIPFLWNQSPDPGRFLVLLEGVDGVSTVNVHLCVWWDQVRSMKTIVERIVKLHPSVETGSYYGEYGVEDFSTAEILWNKLKTTWEVCAESKDPMIDTWLFEGEAGMQVREIHPD